VPRNDQVLRQWHVLRRLEASGGATLQDLVEGLPADYARHVRTLRRDLEALEVLFPVVTDRVNGRTRWRLMDGFRRAPALSFSVTEVMALVLGRDLLQPLAGTQMKAAVDSALAKITSALPPPGLDFVRRMQEFFSVGLGPHKAYGRHRQLLERLSRAVAERRTVQMRYYSASRGRVTRREADPYHLWFAAGGLYLIAYCHRRRDVRMFAVERIRSLTVTTHPFQLPLGFDAEAYVEDALVVMRGRLVEVELAFDRATAAWARDRIWHPSQRLVPARDGLRMTLRVADTRELTGWILSFGPGVRVVRPGALRERVRQEALAVARQRAAEITVSPSRRKSSSNAKQGT
jgi:predicted DNA-binding transcriptional regulator YafY